MFIFHLSKVFAEVGVSQWFPLVRSAWWPPGDSPKARPGLCWFQTFDRRRRLSSTLCLERKSYTALVSPGPYKYVSSGFDRTCGIMLVGVINDTRVRYWICIAVHGLVVLIRAVMVIIWATKGDRSLTFTIDRLSFSNSITIFITSVFSLAMLGLTTWALQPLAMHFAFTRPQTLTALHDQTIAFLGPGTAMRTVWKNGNHRLPASLVLILIYSLSAWGTSSSFSPSFTFESYNESVTTTVVLNSITTALTNTTDPNYLLQSQNGAAFLLASFSYFSDAGLHIDLPGLGNGSIYDTLSNTSHPESRITVPGMAMRNQCGQVPQSNWTVEIAPAASGLNLTVHAFLNERPLSVSGTMSSDLISNMTDFKFAIWKGFEEVDPSTAPSSRNIYLLGLSFDPSPLIVDSRNSTGDILSRSLGLTTAYAQVIGCHLTTSSTTVIIDGLNRPINNTDVVPSPDPHPWYNATPVPSRGVPYEDLFSALFTGPAAIKIQRRANPVPGELQLSLFEELLIPNLSYDPRLDNLEDLLNSATRFSYAALGATYGYSDIPTQLVAAGWDPKPKSASATTPVLRARLHLSDHFTMVGFGASLILFASALMIIGRFPITVGEVVEHVSLLFILSMLRRSSLPAAMNQEVDDQSAMDEDKLRQFGAGVQVHISAKAVLDIAGSHEQERLWPREYNVETMNDKF